MLRSLYEEYVEPLIEGVLDWPNEPIKHYYVVSYIKDDQVGEKTKFTWLKPAQAYALEHHASMVKRYGTEVWTGVELGRRGHIMEWLVHKGHIAKWPYPATHMADVISERY